MPSWRWNGKTEAGLAANAGKLPSELVPIS